MPSGRRVRGRLQQRVMQKPIYLMLAAWRDSYIDAMCVYLLRSLMTPGNAFLLRRDQGHRLLVATTPAGWRRLATATEFAQLQPHLTFELVEIEDKPATI